MALIEFHPRVLLVAAHVLCGRSYIHLHAYGFFLGIVFTHSDLELGVQSLGCLPDVAVTKISLHMLENTC